MALWGSKDNAANSTIWAASQVNKTANTTNRTSLFNNTTANAFITGKTVGQFAIDTTEQQQSAASSTERPTHSGWVLRTVGSGGRAGRVFYETLVAMGSITGDSSNTILPQRAIVISAQPQATSVVEGDPATFTVTASLVPTGEVIKYQWQANGAIINNSGVYSGNNTASLEIADSTGLDNKYYRVVLTSNGATTVYSSNVKLTVT